jgi:uncharacterized protein
MHPIIAIVDDPGLRTRVESAATKLATAADTAPDIIWHLDVKGCVATVAELRPMVVVFDLRHPGADWHSLAWALKSNPATRRVAVLGFAEGLNDDLREQAAGVLFDDVFDAQDTPQGAKLQTLADRIQAYARRSDDDLRAAVLEAVDKPMPSLVYQGLQEFNAREFYEAHEYLEHAWMEEDSPIRDLYRGILQVAVAYYHIEAGNYRGALKMFLRALQWLVPMPDVCHGINVAKLREDSDRARRQLEKLGPEKLAEYDLGLLLPVEYDAAFVPKTSSRK